MAIREHAEGKRDLLLIDPRKLNTDPDYNVRNLETPDAREGLDELKALIRASGVQEALRVREDDEGKLIIVRGHRRHKVVMELIAEDHDIKLVPVTQEPRGTTPADRNWDLIDSNSAAPLPAIERAEVLYRQIHTFGWTEDEIIKRTGKTKTWLNQQLDLRALPEPIKNHVRNKEISPTLARQISKNADPVLAEELIRQNLEENKRIVGSKKRSTKVTPRTVARDTKPKTPEPPKEVPKPEPQAQPFFAEVETPPAPAPEPAVHDQLRASAAREFPSVMQHVATTAPVAEAIETSPPPPPRSYDANQKFFSIIARLATIGEENELNERADDELIGVPAEVIKAADRAYREHIGDTTAEAA